MKGHGKAVAAKVSGNALGTPRIEIHDRNDPARFDARTVNAVAGQPGSMPFALITTSAAGAPRNLMNALATSASLLVADAAAEK